MQNWIEKNKVDAITFSFLEIAVDFLSIQARDGSWNIELEVSWYNTDLSWKLHDTGVNLNAFQENRPGLAIVCDIIFMFQRQPRPRAHAEFSPEEDIRSSPLTPEHVSL